MVVADGTTAVAPSPSPREGDDRSALSRDAARITWWKFGLRVLWVAIQLVVIVMLMLAHQRGIFFYQGF